MRRSIALFLAASLTAAGMAASTASALADEAKITILYMPLGTTPR